MVTELTMPHMGFDMKEGTIVRWLVSEGSTVATGDAIAEIETDKAVVEFESYAEGILHVIVQPEGSTVPVGTVIGIIGDAKESDAAMNYRSEMAILQDRQDSDINSTDTIPDFLETNPPVKEQSTIPDQSLEIRASPVAKRYALEHNLDLSLISGSGPGGRITRSDVESAVNQRKNEDSPELSTVIDQIETTPEHFPTSETEVQSVVATNHKPDSPRVPLSKMRQQIARVTYKSKREKPHFYLSSEIDMTQAMLLRSQINDSMKSEGIHVSVNDIIIKACAEALILHPKFNAYFHEDGLQENPSVNIGIAIATNETLDVPAIMNCEVKSLREISIASKDLVQRASAGTLNANEYAGGTFAISNLGMYDITSFLAIIQPPQTAVLAVGSVTQKPIVKENELAIAQMMTATLSADHRIVDGAEGAAFITVIRDLLQNPLQLVV